MRKGSLTSFLGLKVHNIPFRVFSSKCAFDPFVPPREFRGEGLACDAGRYHTDLAVKATPGGARCARP